MSTFISAKRTVLLGFLFISVCACSPKVAENSASQGTNQSTNKQYPNEVVDAFLDSCERSSGGKKELCACLLAKIQRKYDFEEFSVIEAKVKAGRTPDDFVEFMGKARAECTK